MAGCSPVPANAAMGALGCAPRPRQQAHQRETHTGDPDHDASLREAGPHGYLLAPLTSTSVLTMADDKIELALRRMVDELRELIEEQAREALADALGRRQSGAASKTPRQMRTSGRAVPGATPRPAKARAGNGKRVRRTAADIEAVQGDIIKFLKKNPASTSEQIQSGLGLPKEELQRPLSLLREEKKVKTVGERRGMKYSAR